MVDTGIETLFTSIRLVNQNKGNKPASLIIARIYKIMSHPTDTIEYQ